VTEGGVSCGFFSWGPKLNGKHLSSFQIVCQRKNNQKSRIEYEARIFLCNQFWLIVFILSADCYFRQELYSINYFSAVNQTGSSQTENDSWLLSSLDGSRINRITHVPRKHLSKANDLLFQFSRFFIVLCELQVPGLPSEILVTVHSLVYFYMLCF